MSVYIYVYTIDSNPHLLVVSRLGVVLHPIDARGIEGVALGLPIQ